MTETGWKLGTADGWGRIQQGPGLNYAAVNSPAASVQAHDSSTDTPCHLSQLPQTAALEGR